MSRLAAFGPEQYAESLTLTPEQAYELVESGERGAERALGFLVADKLFQHTGEEAVRETVTWTDAHVDNCVRFNPGKPNRQHALDRVLLAGSMFVNYFFIIQRALGEQIRHPFAAMDMCGPPGCYVVEDAQGDEPSVVAYEENSPEDMFMRTGVAHFTAAAQWVHEQMLESGTIHSKYLPVLQLEMGIRPNLQAVPHYRNTQYATNLYPLGCDLVRSTGSQFIRNSMHFLLLVEKYLLPSGLGVGVVPGTATGEVECLRIAAASKREEQRARFDVPGAKFEKRRLQYGMLPGMEQNDDGKLRVAGLASPPPNPSMCVAQDPHVIPEALRDEVTPSIASLAGLITLWGSDVAPYTLFRRQFLEHYLMRDPADEGVHVMSKASIDV